MSYDIGALKRKMLVKYPFFGSIVANTNYIEDNNISTASTNGKNIYYNPDFLSSLDTNEQVFVLAHEVCHIAFDHVPRSKDKDRYFWNVATDAVINQLLKRDGLPIMPNGVDMPDAINYDAEEFYDKLIEEEKEKQNQSNNENDNQDENFDSPNNDSNSQDENSDSQNKDSNSQDGDSDSQNKDSNSQDGDSDSQNKDSNSQDENSDSQNKDSKSQNGNSDPQNKDSNSQDENSDSQNKNSNSQNGDSDSQNKDSNSQNGDSDPQNKDSKSQNGNSDPQNKDSKSQDGTKNENRSKDNSNLSESSNNKRKDVGHDTHSLWDDALKELEENEKNSNEDKNSENSSIEELKKKIKEMGEKGAFSENRREKKKALEDLKKEIESQPMSYGDLTSSDTRDVDSSGKSKPLLDWRYLLKEATKYDLDWSYRNAEIEDGVIVPRLEELPFAETEIVLDTSGSIDEELLRNFLMECKNILKHSKLKVGCFDTKFYGFNDIRSEKDIEDMEFLGGGGTDFSVAVDAFSRRTENKIIFTDGWGKVPNKNLDIIWIVFGDKQLYPRGGKVINIPENELQKSSFSEKNSRL